MSKKVLYREYDENSNLIKKECCKCGEIKSVDNFYKRKDSKDSIDNVCKECKKSYAKTRYNKNKEIMREKAQHYRNSNKDKIRDYQIRYRATHKDIINDHASKYRIAHKEKINDYAIRYRNDNKIDLMYKARKIRKNEIEKEISTIYENITKNLYPNNDIQYGIIYGIHCINTDRWYIGQTRKSFNLRYANNFFKRKFNELLGDSEKAHLLHEDIEKYGQENFEIIEVLDIAFSEKELDEKEVYYIDLYKAYDEGYNSQRGNIFKHGKEKGWNNEKC